MRRTVRYPLWNEQTDFFQNTCRIVQDRITFEMNERRNDEAVLL